MSTYLPHVVLQMWVTDAIYMPNCHKLAIASTRRDLRFYDVAGNQIIEDYHIYGLSNVPYCMDYHCEEQVSNPVKINHPKVWENLYDSHEHNKYAYYFHMWHTGDPHLYNFSSLWLTNEVHKTCEVHYSDAHAPKYSFIKMNAFWFYDVKHAEL